MGEDLERRHHFIVGVFVVEGDVMYLLEIMKDEETTSTIFGAYAVLVIESGVSKFLELPLLPRFGVSHD